jgi:ABC-type cobalamin transport system permease subunit
MKSNILETVVTIWQPETLSRNERGRFGALKSDSTHHFFRNACTKSGSLRFSQFSGCWLILSVYILMSFDFPFVRLFEFGNFVITLIYKQTKYCNHPSQVHLEGIIHGIFSSVLMPSLYFSNSLDVDGMSMNLLYLIFLYFWQFYINNNFKYEISNSECMLFNLTTIHLQELYYFGL